MNVISGGIMKAVITVIGKDKTGIIYKEMCIRDRCSALITWLCHKVNALLTVAEIINLILLIIYVIVVILFYIQKYKKIKNKKK